MSLFLSPRVTQLYRWDPFSDVTSESILMQHRSNLSSLLGSILNVNQR
ncbi:unnamed protein product [Linum tenue]|uniref:Uncharacterized protein n=1 Tax=Linum tenue TaxID=586396 RepID=A0AAV0IMH4_9ROSI|nr:unnamed protein product [Linum tenue]